MKRCSKCRRERSLSKFGTDRRRRDGRRSHCRECRGWADRIRRYGITAEEYAQRLVDQGDCCAICREPECATGRSFAVDHDHVTHRVRGLLCSNCNNGLGRFKDNAGLLIEAAKYLDADLT